MKKRMIRIGITVLIILSAYLIFDQLRTTTYEKALNDLISENEEVSEIRITYMNGKTGEEKELKLDRKEELLSYQEKPAEMRIKRVNSSSEPFEGMYFISIRTTNYDRNFMWVKDNGDLEIGGIQYKPARENKLLNLLESWDDNFVVRE